MTGNMEKSQRQRDSTINAGDAFDAIPSLRGFEFGSERDVSGSSSSNRVQPFFHLKSTLVSPAWGLKSGLSATKLVLDRFF